jgi:hypothetical protein
VGHPPLHIAIQGVSMAHEYKLTVLFKNTDEKISLSGKFEDEDWARLEEFTQYADELLTTKFVQDGMPASLKIRSDKGSGVVISAKLPPWDDVTVFLHKFRPIGLQSESTYFVKICNILTKELAHPYFRSMIEQEREIYAGKGMQAQFQVRSDNVLLNSEKVLDDWLNAYEYHRDKKKRAFIESLHTMLPLEASKVMFLSLLGVKTIAIHNVAELTRVVLGKQKSVESAVRHPS